VAATNGKRAAILNALLEGPLTNRDLQDVADDCGAYIGRIMAKLQKLGLVINVAERQGRGIPAIYALTDAGLERAERKRSLAA
jgi:DNA-binding PadR family transcriptional regulator